MSVCTAAVAGGPGVALYIDAGAGPKDLVVRSSELTGRRNRRWSGYL